jgi:hypothetical protein
MRTFVFALVVAACGPSSSSGGPGDDTTVDASPDACVQMYTGIGCTQGTGGSMVCTQYTGGPMFSVTITWNAAGGNAYVDYVTAYGSAGVDYNSEGVVGGFPVNICTSGPQSVTFELPINDVYTYKVWHAYCVRSDACSGCGDDVTTETGGPFGVMQTC